MTSAIEAQEPATALISTEEINAPSIFGDGNLDTVLLYIRDQVEPLLDVAHDVEDPKIRKELKSAAYKVTRSKTLLDEAGKAYAAELKQRVANIDQNRRTLRDELDALRDKIRQPVDQWEREQQRRADEIEANIRALIEAGQYSGPSETVEKVLAETKATEITEAAFGDRQGDAAIQKDIAVSNLERALANARKQEAEAVELAELRQRDADREAEDRVRERERRAREEAEAEARAAREKAENDAREAQERAAAAEEEARKAKEDAERAAAEAVEREKRRVKAEADRKREADERRAADIEHRKTVNEAAIEAICDWSDISEEDATTIITLIAAGRVPNVEIRY